MKKFRLKRPGAASAGGATASVIDPITGFAPSSGAAPRAKRGRRALRPPLPGAWNIFRGALGQYWAHKRGFIEILAVVTIPSNLILFVSVLRDDALTKSYVSFVSIAMNVALLWAISRIDRAGLMPGIRQAYYDGSVALLRFIIVSFNLVLFLIPTALSLVLLKIVLDAADFYGSYGPELYIIGALSVGMALITSYFLIRFGLAPFIAVHEGLAPVAALRRSWRMTRFYFWALFARLLLMFVFVLVLSIPAMLVYFGINAINKGPLAQVVFQILATLTALPIADLVGMRLYRHLSTQYDGRLAAIAKAADTSATPAPTEPTD